MPLTITNASDSLCKPIAHAPVAADSPGLNRIVGARGAVVRVERLVEVFRDFGRGRLTRAELIGAARHQHGLTAVPVPMQAKPRMGHWVGGRSKLGGFPPLSGVGGDLDVANRAAARPRQARDLIKPATGQLLPAGRE